ncbi:hypothetical protein BDV25DRAFT_170735 [Aspergillus avenaceus]|uniref:P-loop containing nucleoside triphosphate hydrolase protein n=1 Tax=Aspergillus avenaceus TaxID=36643 RepID=A0A5N6TGC0_ASPAV|nr:hypothetical protein BDV25DRAFT_170735 [Aspergillus avenaceus]
MAGPHVQLPTLEEQKDFLYSYDTGSQQDESTDKSIEHAVLLSPTPYTMPAQFALLGGLQADKPRDPRIMLNTNVPFSAFICGVQGSGKSHTTSCIIENCSLSLPSLGSLQQPLSTLVLNYNEYSSNVSTQPCEAAFLASIKPEWAVNGVSIPVKVLVPPSNYRNLNDMYSQIPNVEVQSFKLKPHHLNTATMLSLMAMNQSNDMPLYMAQVTQVLREMALENNGVFDYIGFRKRLNDLNLDRKQTTFLDQRLDLLESFLDLKGECSEDYFAESGVTILDLSCPFMDQGTTCILFRVAINLFLHAHESRGKMIVADEAHKYMSDTKEAKTLTETFLNIIRQQRHLGVRIVIATQEPTISPRLIDLCSVTIIHRFTSPEWYQVLRKHITVKEYGPSEDSDGLLQISSLGTGEALVFAPTAYLLNESQTVINTTNQAFRIAVRKRVTFDGGKSIMCIQ